MDLDWRVCARARLARDPRFDGKFFIGVRGSGVYCRPICPAPTAKEKNCRYFPTAAAAAEAGFRPCLRCRPESSPGTPAWLGTSTTVSRALRLIHESVSEEGGMEKLAERLGVGSRHLRRLFLKHLGATPNAIVQTRRVHFAKKLIDETGLPMTELAIAAGYGSVRRFNAAIHKTYHRTPTQIRAIARQKHALPEHHYLFRLPFRPPYDWKFMLAFLAATATPGVEAVDANCYRRTISHGGTDGWFEVSLDDNYPALRARIQFGDPRALFFIVERIRALFDLNADWAAIVKRLSADPLLAVRLKNQPGLRVPGCWNGFELATRAIIGRGIGADEAAAVAGSVARLFGRTFLAGGGLTHLFPEPQAIVDADLARVGVPHARAETIHALSRAVCDGAVRFEGVSDSHGFLGGGRDIPGIDEWTAQYVAMRALGEPDAFPSDSEELRARADAWLPWRAYAAMYLWNDLARTQPQQTTPHAGRARRIG
jgi:AraC family transcriptional regulator of adaptative response / DNA-3-methyladenine glycosylase II